MICGFCGSSIPDRSPSCPVCGTSFGKQTERKNVLYENFYEKPMSIRFFFTPVLLGLFSSFFSLFYSVFIGRFGAITLFAVSTYSSCISWLSSLSALVRGLLVFLICRSGKEENGRKAILIVSLVFAFIPALLAPWMLPLFSTPLTISEEFPQAGMMLGLLAASLLGTLFGLLLRPKTIWPYVTAAVLSQILFFVFWLMGSRNRNGGMESRFLVYACLSLEHFAFYAFPVVGLAAAWNRNRKSYLLVSTDEFGQSVVLKVNDPSKLPADPARELPVPGFSVLGFFVPPAGLILYLIWRSTFPGRARSAGKGAIAGMVSYIVISFMTAAVIIFAAR